MIQNQTWRTNLYLLYMGKPLLTAKSLIRMVLSECVYDTKSNLGNAKAISR